MARTSKTRCKRRPLSTRRRIARFEQLEDRRLLAVLLADSFEQAEWNGTWVEDSQNDWFRSTHRASDGSYAAEVDGRATNAALTLASPIDLTAYDSAELTFSWYIESNWDGGEYIAVDGYDGTNWNELASLRGNIDQENVWHNETITIDGSYLVDDFKVRFRANVSSSKEDGHVDNVRIESTSAPVPELSVSDASATEGNVTSSQFADAFVSAASGGLDGPGDLVFGADGNLYVGSKYGDAVLRYNGATGEFIDTFVSPGSGGLDNPQGLLFGSDGHLYVTSRITDEVLRFDSSTGAFIDAFVTAGSGGLDDPTEITFGPDGHLYVSSDDTNQVLRYDGTTGAFINQFVLAGAGGIDRPHGLVFGPDANLYVISQVTDSVLRYDGTTGAFIDTFVASGSGGLDGLVHLAFGPNGDLFVGSSQIHSVLRYDGTSGAFIEAYVSSGNGGLASPIGLLFDSNDVLYVSSRDTHEVLRYGTASQAVFTVTLSSPSVDPVTVNFNTSNATATAGSDYTAASGTLVFAPGVTSRAIIVSTLDDVDVEGDETFTLSLSGPIGATISDGIGQGTIVSDDVAPPTISISDTIADEAGTEWAFADTVALGGGANGGPWGVAKGSTDDVYIAFSQFDGGASNGVGRIQKTDAATGEVDHDFIPFGTAGLFNVKELEIHGGWIYVANHGDNSVLRFDEATGLPDPAGAFVSSGDAGLTKPRGMVFDAAGDLLVSSKDTDEILKFSGTDGTYLGVFASAITGGGTGPKDIAFDDVANVLYVAGNDRIYKYSSVSGTLLGQIVSVDLTNPASLEIGPDGDLYATNPGTDQVLQFSVPSGTLVDASMIHGRTGLAFDNSGSLYVANNPADGGDIDRYAPSSSAIFTINLSAPSVDPVTVEFNTSNGTATAGDDYLAASGTLVFDPGVTSRAVIISSLDDVDVEGDETFTLSLSGPIGATISDGTGLGTIVDDEVANVPPTADAGADQVVSDADNNGSELVALNGSGSDSDGTITGYEWKEGTTVLGTTASISPTLGVGAHTLTLTVTDNSGATATDTVVVTVNPVVVTSTKFYVVDNSVDDMFEYKADGSFVENYNLGVGNNSPKGVAADVTGNTVWVIDNDDHVYVHDNDGVLLRSWKANGLSRPEGIATDGTDVWIVDRGNDRVHYFAGGATRTSDTGATLSFSLVAGNPRGITTDGTHLWVVDASTDDVYKYTVGGSFVGSWALDSRNTTPTGITINPGDVNDIWVIDSTDDDIYQYSAAASRISGGQSADAVFALAGGNTNPQGIADPPPMSLPSENETPEVLEPVDRSVTATEKAFASRAADTSTSRSPSFRASNVERSNDSSVSVAEVPEFFYFDTNDDPIVARDVSQHDRSRLIDSLTADIDDDDLVSAIDAFFGELGFGTV